MKLITRHFLIGLMLLAVAFLLFNSSIAADPANGDPVHNLQQAAAYCRSTGGVVQMRIPEYNTNGGARLILAGEAPFCQYTASDGSNINLFLTTLYTPKPNLSSLAYYAEVPYNGQCEGNPGSCYCSQLGGTDLFGGVNAAGGGWVLKSNSNDVLESCVMPDLSTIDSWGLLYHSQGIIRGIDLSTVLRYKQQARKR